MVRPLSMIQVLMPFAIWKTPHAMCYGEVSHEFNLSPLCPFVSFHTHPQTTGDPFTSTRRNPRRELTETPGAASSGGKAQDYAELWLQVWRSLVVLGPAARTRATPRCGRRILRVWGGVFKRSFCLAVSGQVPSIHVDVTRRLMGTKTAKTAECHPCGFPARAQLGSAISRSGRRSQAWSSRRMRSCQSCSPPLPLSLGSESVSSGRGVVLHGEALGTRSCFTNARTPSKTKMFDRPGLVVDQSLEKATVVR